MKNYRISILALLLSLTGAAFATDGITVNPLIVRQGGTAELEIVFECEASLYKTFQFDVDLPEGLSFVPVGTTSLPTTTNSEWLNAINPNVSGNIITSNHARVTVYSNTATTLAAGKDVLISLKVQASAEVALGNLNGGKVYDIEFSTADNVATSFAEALYTTTVTDCVVLDENSTIVPEAATSAKVVVKRTITAGEWNTICLPFAMSEAQVKAAFGNDVQLADFTGWETLEFDDDDNALGIRVDFDNVTSIEANHPYVIKVSSAMTEFTVDGVDITPEDDPSVSVGKKSKGTLGSFTGSYVSMLIDEECLFLSGNKFWYSVGKTKMKGYRGYFSFQDVMADYYSSAPVKMFIHCAGETGIEAIDNGKSAIDNGEIYDLAGRRVEKANKGIYIINNKKVLVK